MPELLWSLFVVTAVLVLAYLFTKYAAGRLGNGLRFRKGKMTILEQMPVGRDQKLLLVQIGDTVCLLGVAQGGITLLEKISQETLDQWKQEEAGQEELGQKLSFQEALKKVLEQRKKPGRP